MIGSRQVLKKVISSSISHKSLIQTVKCSLFIESKFYQSFYDAPFTLGYFFSKAKVCFSARARESIQTMQLSSEASRQVLKKAISGPIRYKSLIQTVKCSLFLESKFYQSFYDALFTLSYFFSKAKFCFLARTARPLRTTQLSSEASRQFTKVCLMKN